MQARGLVRNQLIYSNQANSVNVHSGFDYMRDRKVVIKTLHCSSLQEVNSTLDEGFTQIKLDHPNICKLYDCFLEENEGEYQVIFVVEYEETDLNKEIESRGKNNRMWEERKLMEMMRTLISVFAFLQRKNACHRDIKPHNIFLSVGGVLKVGDFGSATRNLDEFEPNYTLVGSPLYLSPKLRSEYVKKIIGFKVSKVDHNVYKSDVYSLGLTFLHMATLSPPKELASLENLPEKRREALDQLQYSKSVKDLIGRMLEIEEENRPDFIQLETLLRGTKPRTQGTVVEANGVIENLNSLLKEDLNANMSDLVWKALHCALDIATLRVIVTVKCIQCGRSQIAAETRLLDCGMAHGFCSSGCMWSYQNANGLAFPECPLCAPPLRFSKSHSSVHQPSVCCYFCADRINLDTDSHFTLPCSSSRVICSKKCYEDHIQNGCCPICQGTHQMQTFQSLSTEDESGVCTVCKAPSLYHFCQHYYCSPCLRYRVLNCLCRPATQVKCEYCDANVPQTDIKEVLDPEELRRLIS